MRFILLLVAAFALCGSTTLAQANRNVTAIMTQLLNENYHKADLPPNRPSVKVSMWISRFEKLCTKCLTLTIDSYFNVEWKDDRLAYESIAPDVGNITFGGDYTDALWNPNIGFINAKSFEIPSTPVKNVFTMLFPNGTVWTNMRAIVTVPCGMPVPCASELCGDKVNCSASVQSYRYNKGDIEVGFSSDEPITLLRVMNYPRWTLMGSESTSKEDMYPAGLWQSLEMKFSFQKRLTRDEVPEGFSGERSS